MSRILFLIFVLFISGCSSNRAPRFWQASSIAGFPRPVISILDKPKGKIIASVNTADVRRMISVKERVEEAAGELHTGLLVADDNEPNGFSFVYHGQPVIAINIGMINLIGQDEDAMAALMGHELAHLYLMHGNRRQDREENSIVASTLLSFALGMVGIPIPIEATDVATTSISNSFSRDEEREADQFGVEFMAHAGFDPWGAMRLQEKLGAIAGKSTLPFLSTHPTSAERIENMKRLALETRPDEVPLTAANGRPENIETINQPAAQE
ncbi:MAG: M48 family metalloprotease [Gallionellaceae bacterium]